MKSLLSDNFFAIREIIGSNDAEEKISATLELNPAHDIFSGHFPGNPVVPGVCLIQLIKETLAQHVNKVLTLVKADEAKFMNVVNPEINALLQLEIKLKPQIDEYINVTVIINNGEQLCMKFRGSFKQG